MVSMRTKKVLLEVAETEKHRMKTERKWIFRKRTLQINRICGKIIAIIQMIGRCGV